MAATAIPYDAYAGTIVVHPKGYDDVVQNRDPNDKSLQAQASIFYVAYFKSDAKGAPRPVTFLYNGGPGFFDGVAAHGSVWAATRRDGGRHAHAGGSLSGGEQRISACWMSSDLVFVDAPGTGFSRIAGKDKEKAFWGMDADGAGVRGLHRAVSGEVRTLEFSEVCVWRKLWDDAVGGALANVLETEKSLDLNGVILLSQILNFDASADAPQFNPGVDLPYELVLPTYAASAWYHKKLPGGQRDLPGSARRGRTFRDERLRASR